LVRALIFPISALFKYKVDYGSAAEALTARYPVNIGKGAGPSEILAAVSSIPDRDLASEAKRLAALVMDRAELAQVKSANPKPGAPAGLQSASAKSLKLGLVSDLGAASTKLLLSSLSGAPEFQAMICRDQPAGTHTLEGDISSALESLDVSAGEVLFFCDNLFEIRAAHDAGVEPVVLPSSEHDINTLLAAGPSRMLMSLAEIEDMLAYLAH